MPAPDPELDKMVERLKTARDKAAEELELDRGFLMPRQQLEDVARSNAKTLEDLAKVPDMRRWQVEAMGAASPLPQKVAAFFRHSDGTGFRGFWEAMARRELAADPGLLAERR